MKFSKQFAGLVTKLKRNLFLRARIILTIYYILAIGLVMAVFSALLYFSLTANLRDTLGDQFTDPAQRRHAYQETTDRFQNTIMIGDLIGIIIIGGASYFLAGRTLKPIRRALDDQKQFSSDASHELRTPLAVMQSQSEVVLRNAQSTNDELRSVVSSNLEEAKRMTSLVEELLAVARSEQEVKKTESVDLGKVLSSAINSIKMKSDEKSITIQKNLAENAIINGDASAMYRMTLNLLDNAVAYTEPNGKVVVDLAKDSSQAIVTIKDTGIGISEADLPNIFKRFYKADAARSRRPGSAGLGLAIVNEIVLGHGGSLSVLSEIGKGTEFKLVFPIL